MNPLEALKDKLKKKPIVEHNVGIKVIVGEPKEEEILITKTAIIAERDDGTKAKDILEKIKNKKILSTIRKFKEQEAVEPKIPKAPSIIEEKKGKKVKKLKKDIILEEEVEKPILEPEGGPRLIIEEQEQEEQEQEEQGLEQQGLEQQGLEQQGLEEELEREEMLVLEPKKQKKRISRKAPRGIKEIGLEDMIVIGDTPLPKRIPPPPIYDLKVSSYYMNNREIFINFINGLFESYKEDLLDESKGISCEDIGKDTGEIGLLTHQKIVQDYMNLYSPYRGLLLYHGLGSGKTCSSIAITIAVAEGLKRQGKIIIMTPASLRRNYIEEIKKCGYQLFRKKQFWEWISVEDNEELIDPLSAALNLPREYIRRKKGAWLTNITKPENYNDLTASDKKSLNNQLDEMIDNKYTFINYNGLRREKFKQLTNNFENNIFDNSVVVIDEAHNLISRIVNKINKISKFSEKKRGPGEVLPQALALQLYEFLLRAENCRVVLLTGTPIINYPNEIGILFNILRGYIKTWNFTLNTEGTKKLTKDELQDIFSKEKILDYYEYIPSSRVLTITRNPLGFENKITATSGYKGVTNEKKEIKDADGNITYEERGTSSDIDFIKRIVKLLKKHGITAIENTTYMKVYTALPDTLEEFKNNFIDVNTGNVLNIEKFKRRIIGLTSYFRSAQEELLPSYDKEFDKEIVLCPMSDYQFKYYEQERQREREREKPSKKKSGVVDIDGIYKEPGSTYKIFSRMACNFVMPTPPGRPKPTEFYKELRQQVQELQQQQVQPQQVQPQQVQPQQVQPQQIEKVESDEKEIKFNKITKKLLDEIVEDQSKKEEIQDKLNSYWDKNKDSLEPEQLDENLKIVKAYIKSYAKGEINMELNIYVDKYNRAKARKQQKGGSTNNDEDFNLYQDEKIYNKELLGGVGSEKEEDAEEEEESARKGSPIEEYVEDLESKDELVELDEIRSQDALFREVEELEGDEVLEKMGSQKYKQAIRETITYLKTHSQEYLTPEGLKTYSPKFLAMFENIDDPEHVGLHLVYSQFRSMEGIGIFCLVLEANGFAQFKIKRTGTDGWELNMNEEDIGKPCYALYTGTEEDEEREIIRNVYNGQWEYIPNNIAEQLRRRSSNNNLGEIIKVLMITSAGSEGINLRNTRYVHIMEPYWHPVRVEQVIGRARRICSHQGLAKEYQNVHVFVYVASFTKKQLESEYAIELRLKDLSKREPYVPLSTDQMLLEISDIKEGLSSQLLKGVKESSVDCATHAKSASKEGLVCLSFGQPNVNDWSYNPNFSQDENDLVANINRQEIDWEAREFTLKSTGKKYILRMDTKEVYDHESVIRARQTPGIRPIKIGKLSKNSRGEYEIIKEKV
jgi:3-dehydroquinate dehydratase